MSMKRRDFITLVGGAAAAWPLAARAQQAQVRRIGILMPFAEDHPVGQARLVAFVQGLQQLGWTDGRNVRIDYRWSAGDADRLRKLAMELIALGPDVVMALPAPQWRPCGRRPAPFRSCSRSSPTRWAPDTSRVWRGQAVT